MGIQVTEGSQILIQSTLAVFVFIYITALLADILVSILERFYDGRS